MLASQIRSPCVRHPRGAARAAALVLPLLLIGTGTAGGQEGEAIFSAFEAREIGPAGMSGRVAAVDVDPGDRNRIFVGTATGGLWRSLDGGIEWKPVFDDQPVLGIGAVAVSPANPDLVWVGTGEGNPRNSMGVGYGIFRSVDGGESWSHLGLENSERIHRVIPHPNDPDVAYVAALGPAWSDGEERGVYRTTDGGESWEQILYVDERTGAADLVVDPENPRKLFAAMWEFRRWPWFFESGGEGSGLYVTHDGGDTWEELGVENGLPPEPLGRIGLTIAPSDPRVVYALVEAEKNALLRSDDGGRTFRTVNDEPGINPRPFYYADLRIDPSNENRIYRLAGRMDVSEDGGRSWRTVVPSRIIHGDVHELWVDPDDPRSMIMGNDGGIGISFDRGERWRFVENLPVAQFYKISVDMEIPFNVYGGLQDNGSWFGPMTVWEDRGVMNAHWRRVGGGDGFEAVVDFSDPDFGYAQSQQGNLTRFDKRTGERRRIQPAAPEGDTLRFNWNAPLVMDPHDSTTIYFGSQYVHRSRDQGRSWEIISPDLTTDDPGKQRQHESGGLTLDATGAENHTTILSIAPSPLEEGVLWVSTDDGNVQVTRDGGGSWTNVVGEIEGVPDSTYAPWVEASVHDPATAYVVFDDHRRGNWETYLFRTENYGESWERLPTEDVFGYAHVVEEDPETPNLLFLGTEFGLYVSLDRGRAWRHWSEGMPPAPVRDVIVHPRDRDLVVGTHGRAVQIVDDIRPLEELAADPSLRDREVHLFAPPPAYEHPIAERIGYRSTGHAMFFGDLRPYGAIFSYWVPEGEAASSEDGATIEILDGEGGEVVRTFTGPAEEGLNRVVWDLRLDAPWDVEGGGFFTPQAPEALPGRYGVRVRLGTSGAEAEGSVEVRADPRARIPLAGRREKHEALVAAGREFALAGRARSHLEDARGAVRGVLANLNGDDDGLAGEGQALADTIDGALEELFTGPRCQGICGGSTPFDEVRQAYFVLSSSRSAPSANDEAYRERARRALERIVEEVNRIFSGPVADFRRSLEAEGYTPFPEREPLRIGAARDGAGEGTPGLG